MFYRRSQPIRRGPTCIDVFSGAGGLAEGLRQAGWAVLSGVDVDPNAGATFRLNFPEASFFEASISAVSARKLLRDAGLKSGELDCLVGGPPCQSFSYNNHQRSAANARARLFRDYLRILKTVRPKTVVMENVPGMLTIDGGNITDEIRKALGALGYECEIRILYAEDYGVPQTRRRAFVMGSRVGSPATLFPNGICGPSTKPSEKVNPFVHRWTLPKGAVRTSFETVWDAISDLPALKSGGGVDAADYRASAQSDFQRRVREGSRILYNHQCHDLTAAMLEKIAFVPEGGNWTDIPRRLLTPGMRRAQLTCHTKRYGRLSRKGLASTLLTKCDPHWGAYIHPTQNRTISVREAARLQGFPDRFRFAGPSISKHYTQVGNAVPVPLAKALGIALGQHVDNAEQTAQAIKRFKARAAQKNATRYLSAPVSGPLHRTKCSSVNYGRRHGRAEVYYPRRSKKRAA
jgi:DNA (cytosine-5)-methyltransferase 1